MTNVSIEALEAGRLHLRAWVPGDGERFARLTNTPAVMRWLGGVKPHAVIAGSERRMIEHQRRFGHSFWIVERRGDGGHLAGEMLGFCGLKRADATNCPYPGEFEIGWRLREDAWGHGYAREAAQACLSAGFEALGARTIYAMTLPANQASWGLMVRLGMRRDPALDFVEGGQPAPFCDIETWRIDAQDKSATQP